MSKRLTLWFLCLVFLLGLSACGDGGSGQSGSGQDSLPPVDTSTLEYKINQLTEQLKFSPTNYELLYKRSLLWYDAGNTFEAIQDVDRCIEHNVKWPQGHHLRGFYAYVQNQDSLALAEFRKAAKLGSVDPETFYSMGQIHFFNKEYTLAEDAFDEAMKIDTLQPLYPFAKGYMYESMGAYDKAIKEYEHSLRLDPGFIKSLSGLYTIYKEHKRNYQAAYAYNERILIVDSLHPIGHFNQGDYFLEQADKIADPQREPEFMVYLDLALKEYSQAIQGDAKYARAWYNRGYVKYLKGDYQGASTDFQRVIEIDPLDARAYFMLGSIQEFQGQLEAALSNFKQAVELDPGLKEAAVAVEELESKK